MARRPGRRLPVHFMHRPTTVLHDVACDVACGHVGDVGADENIDALVERPASVVPGPARTLTALK